MFHASRNALYPHPSLPWERGRGRGGPTEFWGAGLFVFPLTLLYSAISYTVFRGKVRPTGDQY